MNIFQELKEKKVLDKDGKVDALGPYGKMKLTGQEVAQYFKKNKVRDKDIKKAVEVALDLGGAMSVAQKEIKKFFGNKILKSKEVQHALKYANEEFQRKESESISEARAMKLKDIARKYKREIEQLAKKGRSPEMGKHKVYMALYNLAWENGDINTDDPDQTDEVIDDYMDEMEGEFFAHLKDEYVKEWIAADGTRRRVHEKDKRKQKKKLKESNPINTYRQMWEDAVEEETLEEKREMDFKVIEKIAKMTDQNDHNQSVIHLARYMREKKVVKMGELLADMQKVNGSMSSDMIAIRKGMLDELLKKAKKMYDNFDDIYKAF